MTLVSGGRSREARSPYPVFPRLGPVGPRFTDFDRRGYRTVDVRTGYAEWVASYEDTVRDEMDLAVLDTLEVPAWAAVRRAADLGCGTGRTAKWLAGRGVRLIDGVDLTPEMLDVARARGLHARLMQADVAETHLDPAAYDLVIASLVDEHLPTLGPLYAEARRLLADAGTLRPGLLPSALHHDRRHADPLPSLLRRGGRHRHPCAPRQ